MIGSSSLVDLILQASILAIITVNYSAPEQVSQLLKIFTESFLSLKSVKCISLTVLSEKKVILRKSIFFPYMAIEKPLWGFWQGFDTNIPLSTGWKAWKS